MILVLLGHDENVFMSRVHVTSALLHSRSRGESVIQSRRLRRFRCEARERPCNGGVAKRAVVCSLSDQVTKRKLLLFYL